MTCNTTYTSDVRARHLVRKRLELLELAATCVFGPGVLVTIVLKHGVSSDALTSTQSVVCLTVHLGDSELMLHKTTKLRPDWCKLLAMTTPILKY